VSAFSKNCTSPDASPILCPRIPETDTTSWEAICHGFRKAPALDFDQPWLAEREEGFRGGRVRIGWRGDRFLYFAELTDYDVGTKASRRNQHLWMLGDVLELFAGFSGHPAYIEYHTAPNAFTLQLRFPDAETFQNLSEGSSLEGLMVTDNAAMVRTRRTPTGWDVFAEVPAASVEAGNPPEDTLAGQFWDVSFGRYDYSHDHESPALSSTSPLTKAAFHSRCEWRQVAFVYA
jgi:hypothetical protein